MENRLRVAAQQLDGRRGPATRCDFCKPASTGRKSTGRVPFRVPCRYSTFSQYPQEGRFRESRLWPRRSYGCSCHNTTQCTQTCTQTCSATQKAVSYLLNVVLYWYMYSCCRYVLVAQGSHDGSLKPRRHPMCRARQQLPVAGWHARPPAPRGGGRHLRHRRPAKALRLPEVLSAVQRVGTLQHARIYLSDYGLCARLATRLRA